MRTLRNNPRKFQEPFKYQRIQTDESSGMAIISVVETAIIFGSIMNTDQMRVSGNLETSHNSLSVKIAKQYFRFRPNDRIIYNGSVYIVISIQNDNYSASEMILMCKYEQEEYTDERPHLETVLQSVLYG